MSSLISHPVPLDVCSMAWLTEMSSPKAEPLSNSAAELAFELNVVCAMLRTVSYACSNHLSSALSTHKLFRLVVYIILRLVAVLHSSEVGRLALEAQIVSQLIDGIPSQVIVEPISMLLEPLILIQSLILSSLHHL
jgi:hypothetical protein